MRVPDMLFLAVLAGAGACASAPKAASPPEAGASAAVARRALAMKVLGGWHDASATAARRMIREYGAPDEVGYGRMSWSGGRPWSRVVVREMAPRGDAELGVLEQSVEYPLGAAPARVAESFDPRVRYDKSREELVSRADREETNILRLNLADEVVGGRMSAEQARAEYARQAQAESTGGDAPATARLRFLPVLVSRP